MVTEPLVVSQSVVRAAVLHGRQEKAQRRESCGLVFGKAGVGTRYRPMENIASEPLRDFAMRLAEVASAHEAAALVDEELLAVVHSHPDSEPIPSEEDKATPDHRPAYLIVGLEDDGIPSLRAWRVDLEFVGQPRVTEVRIEVVTDDAAPQLPPPLVPWALTPGNRIRLSYHRPNSPQHRIITATITSASAEPAPPRAKDQRPKISLGLDPTRGTDPRSMLVERIRGVCVLAEHPDAGRIRQRAVLLASALADCIDGDRFSETGAHVAYVHAAFPPWMRYGVGGGDGQ